LKFLFLEPFFGGSHKDFAQGLVAHSKHEIDLLTLPSRFWKWRMRGAALYFIHHMPPLDRYDGLIVTDLMSLADFKALCGTACPPAMVYFHESQFTYPLAPGERPDHQFGFTDITTALAADRVYFNSHTHYDAFFKKLPGFIGMMPEYRPAWVTQEIRDKAGVLYPGCHFPAKAPRLEPVRDNAPLIVWNHRWEFDKDPSAFFQALEAADQNGARFKLALLGENFQAVPKEFINGRQRWRDRIVQYGFESSRDKYRQWLRRGAVVISTAIQENFGISVIEAVRAGCLPLLPHRLSYPEIVPEAYHARLLYRDQVELNEKLVRLLNTLPEHQTLRRDLSEHMGRFSWENRIQPMDQALEELAGP
jgi:glycosyltransferase involved in cell wall biosynthesis